MKTVLQIEGMTCANCVGSVEKAIGDVGGVEHVNVSLTAQTAHVEHDPSVSLEELVDAVATSGYVASPKTKVVQKHANSARSLIALSFFGLLLVAYAVTKVFVSLPDWVIFVELVLASITFFFTREVFSRGFSFVRGSRKLNMHTLIALGSSAAFIASVITVFTSLDLGIHFVAVILILLFNLIGQGVERLVLDKTQAAVSEFDSLTPTRARKVVGSSEEMIDARSVVVDDLIKVKSGEVVPVDGVISVGAARFDESMLTGESAPVKKSIHDQVLAGTINRSGMFIMRATATAQDSTLARIVASTQQAQASKAPVQQVADRVSAVLVPFVILVSLGTFAVWWFLTESLVSAMVPAISVLVISCPCALGLATPTAVAAGIGRSAKGGVLFKTASDLQRLSEVSIVAFDKTGTLTQGRPEVRDFLTYNKMGEESVLRYAASLEHASSHPYASAIVAYASKRSVEFGLPRSFEEVEGRGVRGKVEGREVTIGNVEFFTDEGIGIFDARERIPELAAKGQTGLLVAVEGKLVAIIGVADSLKDSSVEVVTSLKNSGIETAMLTGDNAQVADVIARQAGIGVVRASLLPEDKLAVLKQLRARKGLAMVGDGINDAPALAAANVGVAVGGASALAVDAAGVVIFGDSLEGVPRSIALSKKTMRTIHQNLWWAFGYNIVAIPLAAGVLIPFGVVVAPSVAAFAMASSSVIVVLNSARLLSA